MCGDFFNAGPPTDGGRGASELRPAALRRGEPEATAPEEEVPSRRPSGEPPGPPRRAPAITLPEALEPVLVLAD